MMNDRLTNEELRRAIRETLADANRSVGPLCDAAVEHLATLRMVERNRATALISAAGGQERGEDDPPPGAYDGSKYVYCSKSYHSLLARQAAEIRDLVARAEAAEARTAELQSKLDEAARLARETAGEAMAFLECKTCAWTAGYGTAMRTSCGDHYCHIEAFEKWSFCPFCGGEIVKGGE